MAAIPDEKVDEVRAASDLVDVVGERVRLKKQGARLVGLCPFHHEKSPSFSVDPRQGLYHCFGCGKGGDVFRFVQDAEGVGFLDAVRLLAGRAGIELVEDGADGAASRRDAMHAALRFAARFYYAQLGAERGRRGLGYVRERGFTNETVRAFGIGYAPDAWDALLTTALEEGFKADVLEAVGLVKAREGGGGHYDVFRDRVTFPILSPVGKVLGFGGRIVPGSRQATADYTPAKYINTAETEVYRKGEVLYGLKQARPAIRAAEEAVLVEGYADVATLHQAGVTTSVAASGTALTAGQARLLATYARSVVLLYDADAAGQAAARKGIDVTLDAGLAPYAVTLPDGADPDAFARQFGAEALRRYLQEERQDFVQFLAGRARRGGALDAPEARSAAVHDLMAAVARVQDPVLADGYLRRAADETGEYESSLRRVLDEGRRQGRAPREPERARAFAVPRAPAVVAEGVLGRPALAPAPPAPPARPPAMRPEEALLLRLMLTQGAALVEHVLSRMALHEFTEGPVRDAAGHLAHAFEAGGEVSAGPFVQGALGPDMQALAALVLADRYEPSERYEARGMKQPVRDADPFGSATSAMKLLKLDRVDEAIDAAKRRVYEAERAGQDVTPLQAEMTSLQALRREVESGAFLDWPA